MNAKDLIAFEDTVAEYFNAAKIRAPVHLYSNNEEQMIDIFKKFVHRIGFSAHGAHITNVS